MLVLQRASVDLSWVGCEHYFRALQARQEKLSSRCMRAFGVASKALLGMHCTLEQERIAAKRPYAHRGVLRSNLLLLAAGYMS